MISIVQLLCPHVYGMYGCAYGQPKNIKLRESKWGWNVPASVFPWKLKQFSGVSLVFTCRENMSVKESITVLSRIPLFYLPGFQDYSATWHSKCMLFRYKVLVNEQVTRYLLSTDVQRQERCGLVPNLYSRLWSFSLRAWLIDFKIFICFSSKPCPCTQTNFASAPTLLALRLLLAQISCAPASLL